MRDRHLGVTPALRAIFNRNGTAVLPPISGYGPHPDHSTWLLVLGLAAMLYLALTLMQH